MTRKRRDRLVGNTLLYDEGQDRELHNSVIIEIDRDQVTHQIGPSGKAVIGKPLTSSNPAVLHFERQKIRQHRVQAYAARPIRSLFVDKQRRSIQPGRCPECNGTREVYVGEGDDERLVPCPACQGR